MPKYIHVANLPVKAEAKHLEDFCSDYGQVTSVQVNAPKARITMASGTGSAAKALEGHVVHGNTLSARTGLPFAYATCRLLV